MGEQPSVFMIPDRIDDVDRRTVLRASGAALATSVVGLAGCAEPEDDGEDGEPIDGTPGEETPTPIGEDTPTPEDEETPTPGEETPTPTPIDEETPTPEGGETPTPTPEDEDA